MFKHVGKSSDLPTEQLERKLWHLGQIASMIVENLLWAARISSRDE